MGPEPLLRRPMASLARHAIGHIEGPPTPAGGSVDGMAIEAPLGLLRRIGQAQIPGDPHGTVSKQGPVGIRVMILQDPYDILVLPDPRDCPRPLAAMALGRAAGTGSCIRGGGGFRGPGIR